MQTYQVNMTREEAAKAIVDAHVSQKGLGGMVKVYIDNYSTEIDFTRGELGKDDLLLYTVQEWTLGELEGNMPTEVEYEGLIDLALDHHGFDMLPQTVTINNIDHVIEYK